MALATETGVGVLAPRTAFTRPATSPLRLLSFPVSQRNHSNVLFGLVGTIVTQRESGDDGLVPLRRTHPHEIPR